MLDGCAQEAAGSSTTTWILGTSNLTVCLMDHSPSVVYRYSMGPMTCQEMLDGVFLLNHELCLIAKLDGRQGTFGSSMEYRPDTSSKFEKESCDSLFTSY
jgi:hypothetical protein